MKLRAYTLSFVLVVSIIGGSVALAGGVAAAPGGMVGVPSENVYSDLPENTPMGQSAQEIADAGAMTTKHADSLEVVVTSPGRAKNVIDGGEMHGSGPVSIVLTDDENSEGRTVALPANEVEAALGYQPEMVRGTHEDGTAWNEEIEYQDGWMLVDVPHFSSNTVSFAGEVQIGDTFTDESTVQYNLSDLDSASDPVVNLTGKTNIETESHTWLGQFNGDTTSVDVNGTTDAQNAELTITGDVGNSHLWSHSEHSNNVVSLEYDPNTGTLYSGSSDSTVKAYDTDNQSLLWSHGEHSDDVNSLEYDPNTGTLYSGSGDSTVVAYDTDTQSKLWSHTLHTGTINSLEYDPNTGTLYSGSNDNTVVAYDTDTQSELWNHSQHTESVRSIDYDPNEGTLYSGSYDKTVVAYDTDTQSKLWSHSEHPASVMSVDYDPNEGTLYSAGDSETVLAYDTDTQSKLWSHTLHTNRIRSVDYDPDSGTLYSGSADSTVVAYDTDTQSKLWSHSAHSDNVYSIEYDPSSTTLYSAGYDNNVTAYDNYHGSLDPSISVDGTTEISVTGQLDGGNSSTTSLTLGTGSHSIDVTTGSTASGTTSSVDVSLQYDEVTETQDPGVVLNDNETVEHTGTLGDGETVQFTLNSSTLQSGTNTVNVSMQELSADAPTMQVGLEYSHDAQDNQSVNYEGEKFSERYNVSKTYASDRTDPTLTIPFADEAVAIRQPEYRVNGGDWQSTDNWVVENTTGTIHLPDTQAGDTIDVRANASKVSVENGAIQVTDPTPLGDRLDSEIKVTSRSSGDLTIGVGDSPDANRIHYAYDGEQPDQYNEIKSSGQHDLVLPNAAMSDTFRVSTIPVTANPQTNEVRLLVENPKTTEPQFQVKPGVSTGDKVEFTFVGAQDDTDYVLFSQTRDVVVDSGTANSPLTLIDDDSEETLQFLLDDSESSSTGGGDSTGVMGPISDGASIDFSGLQYLAYLLGAVLLFLGAVYWFRGRNEAAKVANSASSGTASTVTRSLGWVASSIASISKWLASHPYIAGSLAAAGLLGLFATGTLSLPEGAGVMLLVAGAPLGSWLVLRRWGDQSLVVWGGTTFAALIVGLQLLGTDLFALIFDSEAGVIAMIGLIGLAYYALKTYQTEASTPDEQTNVNFELESDGGEEDGGR